MIVTLIIHVILYKTHLMKKYATMRKIKTTLSIEYNLHETIHENRNFNNYMHVEIGVRKISFSQQKINILTVM